MLKQIKFTKNLFIKLIVGAVGLGFFMNLTYAFGFIIFFLFLGDYTKAEYAVYDYGLLHKLFLAISTGVFSGIFFFFCAVFYSIGRMLFEKDK